MAKRPQTIPRAGSSLLDGVFKRTGLHTQAREWRALYAWHRLAGARLHRHTRAERVLGGTLLVRVATAPWANELSYLRAELLAKLRAAGGAGFITDLRFTIGPLDDLPDWEDPPAPPPPAPAAPPPTVDTGPIAEALLAVADPELRAALADLFARAESQGRGHAG